MKINEYRIGAVPLRYSASLPLYFTVAGDNCMTVFLQKLTTVKKYNTYPIQEMTTTCDNFWNYIPSSIAINFPRRDRHR